ncbi:MAG: PHP domain-containing protein [Rhabdochlamydiaceae bacterium]|nr:PHP domain-containing protein [Candidatus Amphrikana amoebophyrae]
MHSTFSDGTLTPFELIERAKSLKLSGISITDHDSVLAYTPDVFDFASEQEIELMTGVEFSCRFEETTIHILAYNFDPLADSIVTLCARHVQRRERRNKTILERLRGKGIIIDYDELVNSAKGAVGRPHIANALIKKGIVSTIQQAFDQLIGDSSPCYVPGESVTIPETLEVIHQAGGKAFIAHPHLVRKKKMVSRIVDLKIDGIEVYYAKFPPHRESGWLAMAKEKGLLISGGSDFHGDYKEKNPMGCSWVNKEAFNKICQ